MNETKATEFEKALYASIEEMKEEFKVIANTLDMEQEQSKSNWESIKKLKDQVTSLQKDLELERPRYGSKTTREIARDAFNQSTSEANWASLEEHSVIKNIYSAIMDSRKDLGRSIQENALRLDRAKPANEVFAAMADNTLIKLMRAEISKNHGLIEGAVAACDKDRHNGNQQDLKLRDKIADVMTTQDALEFIQAEIIHTYDTAMIFVMGAFASMKYKPVAEGLREILKKPKGGKKKDAPIS